MTCLLAQKPHVDHEYYRVSLEEIERFLQSTSKEVLSTLVFRVLHQHKNTTAEPRDLDSAVERLWNGEGEACPLLFTQTNRLREGLSRMGGVL